MSREKKKKLQHKEPGRFFENIIFTIFLFVLALRATYTETPSIRTIDVNLLLGNSGFSLLITSLLVFASALWFLRAFVSRSVTYRKTFIEIALAVFAIVAIAGIFAASNKRAAITESITLIAPMLMAVVLVQLLDSRRRIALLLTVIAALGIANTHQCWDQFFESNDYLIEQYEQNPNELLKQLNIEPNSFQHMSLEHRLYSKDVRGFMTTSNSASSFLMFSSFASLALFLSYWKSSQGGKTALWLTICGGIVAICFASFFLTFSKGAIAGLAVAFMIFAILIFFGDIIRRRLPAVIIVLLLLAAIVTAGIVFYGQQNGRLPGGNSMLVRWQYWLSSIEIYKGDPVVGVGAGNFANAYMQHKVPAAPETIRDPHNFILSLLCQFGPVGLLAVLAAMLVPLFKSIGARAMTDLSPDKDDGPNLRLLIVAGVTSVGLLVCRPFLIHLGGAANVVEALAGSWFLYVLPVIAFAIPMLLVFRIEFALGNSRLNFTSVSAFALIAGICGVLIHNVIDFAIFEPVVWTSLWASIAAVYAMRNSEPKKEFTPAKPIRTLLLIATGACVVLFFAFALKPVIASNVSFQAAMRDGNYAESNLAKASALDPLDPAASMMAGNFYMSQYQYGKNISFLKKAEKSFDQASHRDPANYKSYQRLSDIYEIMAGRTNGDQAVTLLDKSYQQIQKAVERYPGSGKLHFKMAGLDEKLGKNVDALAGYAMAVEIEDAYRAQFKVMYPGREMFSRLGQQKYEIAKSKLATIGR